MGRARCGVGLWGCIGEHGWVAGDSWPTKATRLCDGNMLARVSNKGYRAALANMVGWLAPVGQQRLM